MSEHSCDVTEQDFEYVKDDLKRRHNEPHVSGRAGPRAPPVHLLQGGGVHPPGADVQSLHPPSGVRPGHVAPPLSPPDGQGPVYQLPPTEIPRELRCARCKEVNRVRALTWTRAHKGYSHRGWLLRKRRYLEQGLCLCRKHTRLPAGFRRCDACRKRHNTYRRKDLQAPTARV